MGAATESNSGGGDPNEMTSNPEVFKNLVTELDGQRETMALAAWIRQPGSGGFGGSAKGAQLAAHTELARGHVVTGVKEVGNAIDAYITGLTYFTTGVDDTETDTAQVLTSIEAQTRQVSQALNQTKADNSAPTQPDLPAPIPASTPTTPEA